MGIHFCTLKYQYFLTFSETQRVSIVWKSVKPAIHIINYVGQQVYFIMLTLLKCKNDIADYIVSLWIGNVPFYRPIEEVNNTVLKGNIQSYCKAGLLNVVVKLDFMLSALALVCNNREWVIFTCKF